MTHTLHRRGDLLKEDYVVLAMSAKGVNEKDSSSKLAEIMRILQKAGAINLGDMKNGSIYNMELDQIIQRIDDRSIIHGVFTNTETLVNALCALKEADLGVSVVVSGLFDEVTAAVRNVGLQPHTVNISLGIWGKREMLPKEEYLKISTMCGHGMISPFLIEKLVKDVKGGQLTVNEAGRKLAECCACGIFNPVRSIKIMKELAER